MPSKQLLLLCLLLAALLAASVTCPAAAEPAQQQQHGADGAVYNPTPGSKPTAAGEVSVTKQQGTILGQEPDKEDGAVGVAQTPQSLER
jgi:hypothetical protein